MDKQGCGRGASRKQKLKGHKKATFQRDYASAMFITIRHGADDQKLFNPDCTLRLFVDNIRKRCHCPGRGADTIALTDEKLSIIHLPELSMDNAASLFTDRGIYVLLSVQKRGDRPPKYTALLDDADQELASKLESLSNPKAGDPKAQLAKSWSKSKKGSKTTLPPTSSLTTSKSKRNHSSSSRTKGKS